VHSKQPQAQLVVHSNLPLSDGRRFDTLGFLNMENTTKGRDIIKVEHKKELYVI